MRHIYTSVDIGTDSIKIVVCELFHGRINLLASSSSKSKGIKKGLITDVEAASSSVKKGIEEIETKLGFKIKQVIASIPSYFAEFELVKSEVEINNGAGEVLGDDIIRVLESCMQSKDQNKEIVALIPVNFIIDSGEVLTDPKGYKTNILQSRSIVAKTPVKNIYSVVALLEKVGLEVIDISLNGIGDIYALKNKDLDEKVGAIINIGSETTNISLYNKGIIVKNSIIGLGGKAIDNDIAYMYKTSMVEAKKVKEKFALAHKKYASASDLYDITSADGQINKINQYEVSEVVMARLEEILSLAKKEINDLTNKQLEYIIITGGTSNVAHLEYLLNEIFGDLAKIARVNIVGLRNNKYSSALGNIVYYISKQKLKGKFSSMIDTDDEESLSSVKKNLINISNESMLGKVVEYFFGE